MYYYIPKLETPASSTL